MVNPSFCLARTELGSWFITKTTFAMIPLSYLDSNLPWLALVDVKAKDRKSVEDQRIKENMELHKEVERFQAKINRLSGVHQEVERL